MAEGKLAAEFIREIFSPTVALVISFDADAICEKNQISFAQLLLPFAQLTTEAVIKDPNNLSHSIKQLRVDFRDIRSEGFLLDSVLTRFLAERLKSFPLPEVDVTNVHHNCHPNELEKTVLSRKGSAAAAVMTVEERQTPWYDDWKKKFVSMMEPGEHEFLKHFLACVLVVSSGHPDPLDQLTKLSQAQHSQQHQIGGHSGVSSPPSGISVISGDLQSNSALATPKHTAAPKWFSPNIFKFHLLIHDVLSGDDKKAESVYQSMKMTYGAHACHLLRINSSQPTSVDSVSPWVDLWRPHLESQFKTFSGSSDAESDVVGGVSTFYRPADDVAIKLNLDPTVDGSVPNGTVSTGGGSGDVGVEVVVVEDYKREVIPHPLSHADLRVLDKESDVNSRVLNTDASGKVNLSQVGLWLSPSDIERIKIFFQEFVQRGLLPFVERQMRLLNDQFASRNWRGKSLLTATKGLFGSRAALTSPAAPQSNSAAGSSVVYTPESAELQVRRLADLAFLFQHFELAFNLYHLLKRDFANDQAWLYYAGALEMASLCVFMMGPSPSRPFRQDYIEGALSTYTSCTKYLLACRCTIFCTEMYKSVETPAKAAEQFIKMTSGESDLFSALFLEQASLCFLRDKMTRKFAIHMILAGHRYSKANQKRHTLRCYTEALKIYSGRQWRLAEDHINYTIGHQSRQLKLKQNCAVAFGNLLTTETLQFPAQQLVFVKEYLTALQELQSNTATESAFGQSLVVPVVVSQEIRVFYGNLSRRQMGEVDNLKPDDLLEKAVWISGRSENDADRFVSTVLTAGPNSQNSQPNLVPQSELLTVELHFLNPFCIPLYLLNSHLLWTFEPADSNSTVTTDLSSTVVQTVVEPMTVLTPAGVTKAFFSLVPLQQGRLTVSGIHFDLTTGVEVPVELQLPSLNGNESMSEPSSPDLRFTVSGFQPLHLRGPRLHKTKAEKTSVTYGVDLRLESTVVDRLPLMSVTESQSFPQSLLAGELLRFPIRLTNVGAMPIRRVAIGTFTPQLLNCSLGAEVHQGGPLRWTRLPVGDTNFVDDIDKAEGNVPFVCQLLPVDPSSTDLPVGGVLDVWLSHFTPTTSAVGPVTLDFLLFYECSIDGRRRQRSRCCRYSYEISASMTIGCRLYPSPLLAESTVAESSWKRSSAQVELTNVTAATEEEMAEFHLLQLFCFSRRYKVIRVISDPSADVLLEQGESKGVCVALADCRSAAGPTASESRLSDSCQEELVSALEKFSFPWSALMPWSNGRHLGVAERLFVIWKANLVRSDGSFRSTFGLHSTVIPSGSNLQATTSTSDLSPTEPIGFVGLTLSSTVRGDRRSSGLIGSLCYTLEYNAAITHDFTSSHLCPVPVCLRVRNLFSQPVRLRIEGNFPASVASGAQSNYSHRGCQPICWLQVSTKGTLLVPVGDEILLLLTAVAAHPGVFDLGSLVVKATVDNFPTETAIFPRHPHYVTVKQQQFDWAA